MHEPSTSRPSEPMLHHITRTSGVVRMVARRDCPAQAIAEARSAIHTGEPIASSNWCIRPLSQPKTEPYAVLQTFESGELISMLWIVWGESASAPIFESLDCMPRTPGVVLRQPTSLPWMAEMLTPDEDNVPPERLGPILEEAANVAELAAWAVIPQG